MKVAIGTLLAFGAASAVIVLAQQNTPPKYPTCPTPTHTCNVNWGSDVNNPNTSSGCTKWCSELPLKITPDPIQACAGQAIQGINVRVDGAMDTMGNALENFSMPGNVGGNVNWGDGKPEDNIVINSGAVPFNRNFTHTYDAAGTYYPSATVAQQFKYTGNGSCGYTCRSQQSDIAIVYLANSPKCATGVFEARSASAGARNNSFPPAASAQPGGQSQSCQICKEQCVTLYQNCASNACVSSGGHPDGAQGCRYVQDTKKYSDLVKICSASETACLKNCTATRCP